MNKYFKILIFILIIWALAYLISFLIFDDTSVMEKKVAIIPIDGMITYDGGSSFFIESVSGESIAEKIESVNQDNSVKAIVLEINSPGGTVMGTKVVVDAIKEVDKPIVSVITESGTSGAYWIASQTDAIFADELSYVGSIGVIGSYLEFDGLLDDYNVTYRRLVTGDYKDIGSPYREMTSVEEGLMMDRLDKVHEYFVESVAEGREMSVEEVEDLSNGIFYLGMDCVDNGLIDYIGSKDDAVAYAQNLTGDVLSEIDYKDKKSWFSNLEKFSMMSSYFVGQGIGSVLVQGEKLEIKV
ncbi:signal peptide peptidase SppA [Candidatus Woesearchaeota archaeon]|nr:signal peptide peptidase SppA [Candidatus Woesearchaeota archaeon]